MYWNEFLLFRQLQNENFNWLAKTCVEHLRMETSLKPIPIGGIKFLEVDKEFSEFTKEISGFRTISNVMDTGRPSLSVRK